MGRANDTEFGAEPPSFVGGLFKRPYLPFLFFLAPNAVYTIVSVALTLMWDGESQPRPSYHIATATSIAIQLTIAGVSLIAAFLLGGLRWYGYIIWKMTGLRFVVQPL